MHRVCLEAEKELEATFARGMMDHGFLRVDEAIAMSAAFTALNLNIKAIAAMNPIRLHRPLDEPDQHPCADLRLDAGSRDP